VIAINFQIAVSEQMFNVSVASALPITRRKVLPLLYLLSERTQFLQRYAFICHVLHISAVLAIIR